MSTLPAAQPRHVVSAVAGAWTLDSGVPTKFKFAFGTWTAPATGQSWGIVSSYNANTVGEKSNLKDEGGSSIAIAIMDPGWNVTLNVVHDVSTKAPARGSVISLFLPSNEKVFNPSGGGEPDLYAVVTDVAFKWEREGWRSIDVTAEFRESLNLADLYSASIKEDGAVANVIHSPA